MKGLVSPEAMPKVRGFSLPRDLYIVIDDPAILAGMPYPSNVSWKTLYEAGIYHVVCLSDSKVSYDPSPLKVACAVPLQDLVGGGPPRNPQAEEALIRQAVSAVVDHFKKSEGVAVHCAGGRGRTGTVLGCVLVSLGYDAEKVVSYLNQVHKARGKPGWPESPWQAQLARRYSELGAG